MSVLLFLACAALFVGPALYSTLSRFPWALQAIDGFVFISIGGLLLGHLAGEITGAEGLWVVAFLFLGFLGPLVLESAFHRLRREVHLLTLLAGAVGFLVHAAFDGTVLISESDGTGDVSLLLAVAVVVHRIPVGLTLWWLLRPRFGFAVGMTSLLLTVAATVAGSFLASTSLISSLHHSFSWVQAFVAGSILHVVFFRFHLHGDSESSDSEESDSEGGDEGHDCCSHAVPMSNASVGAVPDTFLGKHLSFEGLGNLLGFLLLIVFFMIDPHLHHEIGHQKIEHAHHHAHHTLSFQETLMSIVFETAPALCIAYLLGIFIFGFFPEGSTQWLKKGGRLFQSAKGMVVGLPLPVCSCGVLPYYQTLVKRGAPPAAAVAFLIATPELGLDALLISFPLLGGELTLIRLVASAVIAFVVSYLISHKMKAVTGLSIAQDHKQRSVKEKFRQGIDFAFFELVDTTAPWMIFGLVLAAVAAPLLDMHQLGLSPIVEVLLFSCVGIVVYVCASGATPLVAALIAGGVSPGAGLAFLITGPATNISTFGVLSELHGRKVAFLFGALMMGSAILLGIVTNLFLGDFDLGLTLNAHEHGGHHEPLWRWITVVLVAALYLASFLRQGGRKFFSHVWKG